MNELQKLLLENKPDAERSRFGQLIREHREKLDAAAEALARLLRAHYTQFRSAVVEAFMRDVDLELPGLITDRLHHYLDARIARTRVWHETLRGVGRERLAREARRAIVTQDLKWAA